MSRPVIVIDLDNVLARSVEDFVTFSNEHFGTHMATRDYSEDWCVMWGVSYEEAERRSRIMREHRIHCDYKPMAKAAEVLGNLCQDYRLIILTSRRQVTELETTEWLDKHYPSLFDEVLFSGIWEDKVTDGGYLLTKGDQYRKLHAGYVIDDHLKHCVAASEYSIPAVLFGSYSWNHHDKLPVGVVRCKDWLAVMEYFDGRDG